MLNILGTLSRYQEVATLSTLTFGLIKRDEPYQGR